MWLFQLFRGVWHRLNCGPLETFLLCFMKDCLPFTSWLRLCGEPSQLIVCLSKALPLCYNDGKYCFSKWLRCIKSKKSLRQDKVEWVKSESKSFGYLQKMCSLPLQWDSHGKAVSGWEKCHSICTKDSKVWGCLSWKDVGYNMTDQAYMLIPVLGFQLVPESRWRPLCIVQSMVDQALRCQRCSCGPAPPWHFSPGSSDPSSCKFVSWGISTLCAGSPSQQENGGRNQEQDPNSAQGGGAVVGTKIREWVERRSSLS